MECLSGDTLVTRAHLLFVLLLLGKSVPGKSVEHHVANITGDPTKPLMSWSSVVKIPVVKIGITNKKNVNIQSSKTKIKNKSFARPNDKCADAGKSCSKVGSEKDYGSRQHVNNKSVKALKTLKDMKSDHNQLQSVENLTAVVKTETVLDGSQPNYRKTKLMKRSGNDNKTCIVEILLETTKQNDDNNVVKKKLTRTSRASLGGCSTDNENTAKSVVIDPIEQVSIDKVKTSKANLLAVRSLVHSYRNTIEQGREPYRISKSKTRQRNLTNSSMLWSAFSETDVKPSRVLSYSAVLKAKVNFFFLLL